MIRRKVLGGLRRRRRVVRRRGRGPTVPARTAARPAARPSMLRRLHDFIKEHKFVSRSLGAVGTALAGHSRYGALSTPASLLGRIAAAKGYGRRKRRVGGRKCVVRRRRGGNIFGSIGRFFRDKVGPGLRSAGNFVADKLRKPSTYLSGLAML